MVNLKKYKICFSETRAWSLLESEEIEVLPLIGANQEDPALVAHIRRLLVKPSVFPYNLTHPEREHFSQHGPKQYSLTDLLNQVRHFSRIRVMSNYVTVHISLQVSISLSLAKSLRASVSALEMGRMAKIT